MQDLEAASQTPSQRKEPNARVVPPATQPTISTLTVQVPNSGSSATHIRFSKGPLGIDVCCSFAAMLG